MAAATISSTLPLNTTQPAAGPTSNNAASGESSNPVAAFVIGLVIILLASILNAAGLNLTKWDHIRTSEVPKASRRRDWLRPLWLLGMILYILSQLLGSTLALDYMRAEYVAPLGSMSLIFNFLFARFLVGTPVTQYDIYGTIVVVVGVIGIVAFGGINSGLSTETDVAHISKLWGRAGWLGFFICMSIALGFLLIFATSLDAVLVSRSDLSAQPFNASARRADIPPGTTFQAKFKGTWDRLMVWVRERLELWTAVKDDKQIAWTLGIGWACCGGGLAGGCLVFAKATVKLLTGSLSHQNPGNQFGHVAPIVTIILLAITAVLQIVCLNRGLKIYDSTLVVPVFYGVYTITGFIDSLIFNNEVSSYQTWTLFLIFISIMILISGVILLTYKKPTSNMRNAQGTTMSSLPPRPRTKKPSVKRGVKGGDDDDDDDDDDEEQALRLREEGDGGDGEVLWQVGEASDDEAEDESSYTHGQDHSAKGSGTSHGEGEEGLGLMQNGHVDIDDERTHRRSTSSDATLARNNVGDSREPFRDDVDEFGEWKDGAARVL